MMTQAEVLAIEEACLKSWPALDTIEHLSWQARFARGYTKRANSIHATDPEDGANAPLRLDAMAGEYRARGLPPIFRVTPLTSPAIVQELDQRGWARFEPSLVLVAPTAMAPQSAAATVRHFSITDPAWSEAQASMAGYGAETLEVLRLMLAKVTVPATGLIVLDEDGRAAGAAMATVADGIGLYFNVVVDPDRRGRGFGRAVMAAALDWAEANGARRHAIQVLEANEAAVPLYRSLGFEEAYGYHYRRDPS
jgi:GNAT superfamily N-acetyltransferase